MRLHDYSRGHSEKLWLYNPRTWMLLAWGLPKGPVLPSIFCETSISCYESLQHRNDQSAWLYRGFPAFPGQRLAVRNKISV